VTLSKKKGSSRKLARVGEDSALREHRKKNRGGLRKGRSLNFTGTREEGGEVMRGNDWYRGGGRIYD